LNGFGLRGAMGSFADGSGRPKLAWVRVKLKLDLGAVSSVDDPNSDIVVFGHSVCFNCTRHRIRPDRANQLLPAIADEVIE